MMSYANLKMAKLDSSYIDTNATTHEFLFGALAELVDNSRDAGAKCLKIYTQKLEGNFTAGFSLNFLDDGQGMNPDEAQNAINFGYSFKREQEMKLIGQYGNGLKSSTARIGRDMMLFTKKDNVYSLLCLSRTFLDEELKPHNNREIRYFNLNFHVDTMKPFLEGERKLDEFEFELELIKKYSPFKTFSALTEQMKKISTISGTLVICYNLRINENAQSEFDIESDKYDIRMADLKVDLNDRKSQEEHNSFRSYVSILYDRPRMKVYIQDKKVRTKMLEQTLFFPRSYEYRSTNFKAHDEKEKSLAENRLKNAKDICKDRNSSLNQFKIIMNKKSKDDAVILAKKKRDVEDADSDVQRAQFILQKIKKDFNKPKVLKFTFGVNVNNRAADGLFVYNAHRLILMYEHTKQQSNKGYAYRGIVGVVNIPSMVLEPAHNKQKFVDNTEERRLKNEMGNYMEHYLNDLKLKKKTELNLDFWKQYGYDDMDFRFLPSDEEVYKRKRVQNTNVLLQCDRLNCLKWRVLPYNRKMHTDSTFPRDDWVCENNTEIGKDSCRDEEKIPVMEVSEIQVSKTQETKSLVDHTKGVGFLVESENKSSAKVAKRRRHNETSDDSDSTLSTVRRYPKKADYERDPTFRPNFSAQTKKNSKKINRNQVLDDEETFRPTEISSVFEANIIENEVITDEMESPFIKTDPDMNTPNIENDPSHYRYSFESGIHMKIDDCLDQSIQFTPRALAAYKDVMLEQLKANLKNMLVRMADDLKDQQLSISIKRLNDEELINFDGASFYKTYKANIESISHNKAVCSNKLKLKEILKQKGFDQSEIDELISKAFVN